jgi:hypothetical protein
MAPSTISYLWRDPGATSEFETGVSLHSHTNQSRETLDFVAIWSAQFAFLRPLMRRLERRSRDVHSLPINWTESFWTPPLTPKLAFDLESGQIEKVGLRPLVSITDHDNIHAPLLLRSVPSARHIPISVEWTAPYAGNQAFHFGVHNLPSDRAAYWMGVLNDFTAKPNDDHLTEILAALNDEPNVLLIFNHPVWDLYMIGKERHLFLVNQFLQKNGAHFHALELNGLRNWDENRATRRLAEQWNMQLISGGDRHGTEANANINLTNATSFTEFVHEIRRERRSNVLFMPQYKEPWKHRILQSTMDAIRSYPEFPQGSQSWDERVYHPNRSGEPHPLRQLWPNGKPPRILEAILYCVRMMGRGPVSSSLRYAWDDSQESQFALGDQEAF